MAKSSKLVLFAFFVPLLGLTTGIWDFCVKREDGQYPDPDSCTRGIICTEESPTILVCNSGEPVFDPVFRKCTAGEHHERSKTFLSRKLLKIILIIKEIPRHVKYLRSHISTLGK
jgi:Chitin binding Peritrophin-A domain